LARVGDAAFTLRATGVADDLRLLAGAAAGVAATAAAGLAAAVVGCAGVSVDGV
jgi:hypothetical protein